jgi:hypothetical protein
MNPIQAKLALALFGIAFLVVTWREYRRVRREKGADPKLQHHRKRAIVGYALGLAAMGIGVISIELGGTLLGTIGLVFFVIAVVSFGYGMVSLIMIGWIKGGGTPIK